MVLPFIQKIFPDAKYVALTRHPLAILSSYANSFFNGDYEVAQKYNPIVNRYVPAIAKFLREARVPLFHVRYEDLVSDPEQWMERIYAYLGVPFEKGTIDYGERAQESKPQGLGDPIGVKQHSRPSTASVNKWTAELLADAGKLAIARSAIQGLDPDDLRDFGFPAERIWEPLDAAQGKASPPRKPPMTRYRLERKLIVTLRGVTQRNAAVRKLLTKARLAADVLLRE